MAFFDNFGKKASEMTAKAVQKAQELSETTKLNSLISEEEKKINNTYYQIGKLYVSLHSGDSEEAFAGMVASVAESEQKIGGYRRQIQDIKGVQRCERCGAEVARGVAFCSSCGAPMPRAETAAPAEDMIRCEGCGAMVKRGMRFCTSCGKALTPPAAPAVPAEPPVTETPAAETPAAEATAVVETPIVNTPAAEAPAVETPIVEAPAAEAPVYCSSCGAKVEEGCAFCTECGARIE